MRNEFGFACMSDVPNPQITGLTGFMFKQKQRANSANTHKHLCGHTLHTRIVKCTEDSLILFWVKHTHFGLLFSVSQKHTHYLSLSLLETEYPVSCPFCSTHTLEKHAHSLESLNSVTHTFWSLTLNLQCQWADVCIKAATFFKDSLLYFLC